MESAPNTSAQRHALQKQLLREEKCIVNALKTIKDEHNAIQRERTDLQRLINEILNDVKILNAESSGQGDAQTSKSAAEQDDSKLPNVDDIASNMVGLNLTDPTQDSHNQLPKEETGEKEEKEFETGK